MIPRPRTHRPLLALSALLAVGAAACAGDDTPTGPGEPPSEPVGTADAFGIWEPGPRDTCSKEIHDAYSVTGPDGLLYPTWHPPVDPVTGCTFGHEHGRDPSGSDLFPTVGPIPFGLANQHLPASGFAGERHEDHVGHKIEWENDVEMQIRGGGGAALDVRCDILVKLHQGTHSPDAFTNNLHELAYHIRCTDGTGFSVTLLTPIGDAGQLVVSCDRGRKVNAGAPAPLSSPDGGGKRAIPDASCIREHVLRSDGSRPRFDRALRESWEIGGRIRAEGGRTLVRFNPYFQVRDPSRFFDPALQKDLGRPVDLCTRPELAGRDRCEAVPTDGSVTWDDPASPFKGTRRFVDVNANRVKNADGPTTWYTDPLGHGGQPFPFPGSIRQWIADIDNSALDLHGPILARHRDYDAPGVHAPN